MPAPREPFYILVEYKPELMTIVVHETFEVEKDIDAHREARVWIKNNRNKHVKLLKCQSIGEYAFNSVFFPEDWNPNELREVEDPQ